MFPDPFLNFLKYENFINTFNGGNSTHISDFLTMSTKESTKHYTCININTDTDLGMKNAIHLSEWLLNYFVLFNF